MFVDFCHCTLHAFGDQVAEIVVSAAINWSFWLDLKIIAMTLLHDIHEHE
jgi:hypothetical protein